MWLMGGGEPVETPASPRTWHVWVNLSRGKDKRQQLTYPGLVLSWRRTRETWEALVVYVTPNDGDETSHVTWIEAGQLTPVNT